ncbi:MAG: fused MFS/spermidine synthase, partial [bacterium]
VAFNHLPALYMRFYEAVGKTWQSSVLIEFLLSAMIMIVPAVLMGGTFPLVARIYATDLGRVGRRIGVAYAFNTVGSILGSFIGSFVLLEALGVEKGMMVVTVIYLAVGAVLLARAPERPARRIRLAASAAVAVGAVFAVAFGPKWDKQTMTSGVYIYAGMFGTPEGLEEAEKFKQLLYYDEGPGATVAVERNQFILSLKIDGKVDASTAGDMITQELIAHLPLLLHPKPDTVLVVGLGSGMSLGSAGRHPVRHIDCVELLENVVRAQRFYADTTYHCLEDPRVNLILGDGRNHVLLSDKKYDVIISEPTNCWISGVGDLFTREFFLLARERLKPGGVMSAWFQTYHMGDAELRSGVRTFLEVFPHVSMWLANESDLVLVGSLEPHKVDPGFIARMDRPEVAADLARVGVATHADLLSAFLMDRADLEAYAGRARIHTDDNMLMEFHTGRRIYETTQSIHLAAIIQRYGPTRFEGLDDATNAETARQVEAKRLAFQGTLLRSGGKLPEALAMYTRAYQLAPGDPHVAGKYVEAYYQLGDALLLQGKQDQAADAYLKVVAAPVTVNTWTAWDGLGVIYLARGLFAEARDAFEAGFKLNPYNSMAHLRYGDALIELADTTGAVEAFARAYSQGAWNLEAGNKAAWYYAERGQNLQVALEMAEGVTRQSKETTYLDTLGWVYYRLGDVKRAGRALEQALKVDPKNFEAAFHLAVVRRAEGDGAGAERLLRKVVELDQVGDYGRQAGAMLNE